MCGIVAMVVVAGRREIGGVSPTLYSKNRHGGQWVTLLTRVELSHERSAGGYGDVDQDKAIPVRG